MAEELGCKLIVAFTESGTTAHLVSTYRPRAPIAAVTSNADTYRRLAPVVGRRSGEVANSRTRTDEMIVKGEALLKAKGLVAKGDTVLMLAGQSHTAGATNMLRVHTIS